MKSWYLAKLSTWKLGSKNIPYVLSDHRQTPLVSLNIDVENDMVNFKRDTEKVGLGLGYLEMAMLHVHVAFFS